MNSIKTMTISEAAEQFAGRKILVPAFKERFTLRPRQIENLFGSILLGFVYLLVSRRVRDEFGILRYRFGYSQKPDFLYTGKQARLSCRNQPPLGGSRRCLASLFALYRIKGGVKDPQAVRPSFRR